MYKSKFTSKWSNSFCIACQFDRYCPLLLNLGVAAGQTSDFSGANTVLFCSSHFLHMHKVRSNLRRKQALYSTDECLEASSFTDFAALCIMAAARRTNPGAELTTLISSGMLWGHIRQFFLRSGCCYQVTDVFICLSDSQLFRSVLFRRGRNFLNILNIRWQRFGLIQYWKCRLLDYCP